MKYSWIVFCPQLPATPSSPRVNLWRRMRSFGALGLDNAIWVLPQTEQGHNFILEMKDYVLNQGGTSNVFLASTLDEETEKEILDGFNRDRADEYFEVIEQCGHFLEEISRETKRENFSFAEFEENEADLNKLEIWLERVEGRDFLGTQEAKNAREILSKCVESFQEFTEKVFNLVNSRSEGKSKLVG